MRLMRSAALACLTAAAVTLSTAPVGADEALLSNLRVLSATFEPRTGWGSVEVSVDCAEEVRAVEFWAGIQQRKVNDNYDNWGDCRDGVATTIITLAEGLSEGERFRGGPAVIWVTADGYCYENTYCGAHLVLRDVPWKLSAADE